MGVLSHMPLVVLLALLSVFFLAACTQAVHALFIATRREVSPARVIFAYEMLIVVHLVLACCTANWLREGSSFCWRSFARTCFRSMCFFG